MTGQGAVGSAARGGTGIDGAASVVLEASGLKKVYGDGEVQTTALDHCDVRVRRGELLMVVGPSGSGKSTLLHLLSGLDQPTSGRVVLDGVDLAEISDADAARLRATRLGFVLQRANLVPSLTVRENVAAPLMLSGVRRDEALKRADAMLERVGVAHRCAAFPGQVSGGEAQRAAVARSCIGEPAVIFADEPTGALDQAAGTVVMELFEEMARAAGAGAVIVTHDPSIAERGDAKLELLDGRPVR